MSEEQKEKEHLDSDVDWESDEGTDTPAESDSAEKECEQLLHEKEEEVVKLQDRILRLAAEMENTRKRLEREKSEGICFANESLMRELLGVLDNFERAIQHAESGTEADSLLEGIRMIHKGLLDSLAKFGCKPFESVGETFDPNLHEAVMQQEAADEPENVVLQELQKGYRLNDRLLRPAMVVVSKAADRGQ
ncbi:nucleotide exchange factor GrpE [Desulfoferrobacter suflitae]|uniref:nucleotide exchange factor GrpE n=1 Tax=Desulfoferrobacter suflitae TaxID=2865782 RepID=UPI002164486C|nr:nucleotide exchange factor GrpE [Desulfoferrobacter suflitae]MCK8603124.1 nucleotide exchange factor GrpE [Desulfoferrobacter suflitae]